jgi:hypothetical protein
MDKNSPDQDILEALAAAAHNGWMEGKRADGITSRQSEWLEELMVPYAALSERAKEIDRSAVRSVLEAIAWAGYRLVPA